MCLALILVSIAAAGCGKSKSGGGGVTDTAKWYQDSDNDGFGNPDKVQGGASQPEGYVDNSNDCDDENYDINPAASEIFDGIDNNCDGQPDEEPAKGVIPDTGQIVSYTDTSGEDSDYTIDPPSYTKLDANGQALPDKAVSWSMVKDNVTGLIWELKNTSDNVENFLNIHDADNTYTWEDASSVFIKAMNDSNFGNFSDGYSWRLPTSHELMYLSNSSLYNPVITKTYFPQVTVGKIWSKTPCVDPETKAWCFFSFIGQCALQDKTNKNLVWAVRGKELESEFEKYDSNIIVDKTTGLMWQIATVKGDDEEGMTFEQALEYSENLTLGGFKDWRLPNKNELASLLRYDRQEPAIDDLFSEETVDSWYWTSTTYITSSSDKTYAWAIDFYLSSLSLNKKTELAWVRAVRGGSNKSTKTWYRDSDSDGYGDSAVTREIDARSPQPTGYVDNSTDCNDSDSSISPAAEEIEDDGIDQNCTGSDLVVWYKDADTDKYGDENNTVKAESEPEGYVRNSADCDDANISVNPGMAELVDDGLDNDCNGLESVSWYWDSDGDGYGSGGRVEASEYPPVSGSYAPNDLDCNDGSADIRPGLVEIFGDMSDSNCNGYNDDENMLIIIPDTGQLTTYADTPEDDEDGDFRINSQSYTKISESGALLGVDAETWVAVRDNVTGLYWEVKTLTTKNAAYTYDDAADYAESIVLGGFDDWRLPTLTELATIANLDLNNPAIDSTYFANMVADKYWTSTDQGSDQSSIAISFRYSESYTENKSSNLRVIAVRGGQSIAARLIRNGNDTVIDTETGLIWNDILTVDDTWNNSMIQWASTSSAGYSDWRLPTESDMATLLEILNSDDTFALTDVFENITFTGSFWTSTLALTDPAKAVVLSFITGEMKESLKTLTLKGLGVRGERQNRFIANSDGTVYDSRTGLMWMQETANAGTKMTFRGALNYCNTLTYASYNDWRIPNRNEMMSLLDAFMEGSSGYSESFADSEATYWTSSSCSGMAGYAWQIGLKSDSVSIGIRDKFNTNVFRAVRGGNPE